jgi:hypothetical protein
LVERIAKPNGRFSLGDFIMTDVGIQVRLQGSDADRHLMPAYDGFNSLAGLGLTLSLTAHYAETGQIRRRGDYLGRHSVKATVLQPGSVLTDFIVSLPKLVFLPNSASDVRKRAFFNDLFQRVLDRNIGVERDPTTDELNELLGRRDGDLEALVAATEPSVRQAHSVIGEGAQVMDIYGGKHQVSTFNGSTKQYVNGTIVDRTVFEKDVSVSSFNVNSGYGGVFDFDLQRVVAIKVTKETLPSAKPVLGWGLNEYARSTGRRVFLKYYRWLAYDDTPKKYIVVDARMPPREPQ